MKRPQMIRFAAFVTVLAVLLGYVVYHRTQANTTVMTGVSSPTNKTAQHVASLENYFVNYRMHRDQLMSQEIATLKTLVNNPSISQTAKDQAAATMVADTQELKHETQIEGLLSAQGFPLSAVTIAGNKVDVTIGGATISNQQVARIAAVVTQVTSLPPENVVIVLKK